jgi:methylenetetrahydrofolate reductase (NADPH)
MSRPVNGLPARAPVAAARLEVIPVAGVTELVAADVPTNFPVTVTCSPRQGVERTVTVCEDLARHGYRAIPHLAAHEIRGRAHLDELLARLRAVGLDDVFAVGGDGLTADDRYPSAVELVEDLAAFDWLQIGVAAYPEGHPSIPISTLDDALTRKAAAAAYVVTQMCFDASHLLSWLSGLRDRGVVQPVLLGVPGVVQRRKLIEMSLKIGVGGSVRYLRNNPTAVGALLRRGAYTPEELLGALQRGDGRSEEWPAGLHIFTFNQLAETVTWLEHANRSGEPDHAHDARTNRSIIT